MLADAWLSLKFLLYYSVLIGALLGVAVFVGRVIERVFHEFVA